MGVGVGVAGWPFSPCNYKEDIAKRSEYYSPPKHSERQVLCESHSFTCTPMMPSSTCLPIDVKNVGKIIKNVKKRKKRYKNKKR